MLCETPALVAQDRTLSIQLSISREIGTVSLSVCMRFLPVSFTLADSFTARFFRDRFSENQFNGMDWSNVFVAGGSVLSALTQDLGQQSATGDSGFRTSDIDLFLYGLSEEEANEKVA